MRAFSIVAFAAFFVASGYAQLPTPSNAAPATQAGAASADGPDRKVGGGVSAPVLLHSPAPELSDEARRMKKGGTVLVYLEIDTSGNPVNVRVLRGCGYGLDEEAVKAVRHYRFKPAKKDGVPVQVRMNVEVNFEFKTYH